MYFYKCNKSDNLRKLEKFNNIINFHNCKLSRNINNLKIYNLKLRNFQMYPRYETFHRFNNLTIYDGFRKLRSVVIIKSHVHGQWPDMLINTSYHNIMAPNQALLKWAGYGVLEATNLTQLSWFAILTLATALQCTSTFQATHHTIL